MRLAMQVPDEPIEQVYFPASGITSIAVGDTRGKRIEAGLFGRDGMTGQPVVMGDDRSPHKVFIQVEGQGHRMAPDSLPKPEDNGGCEGDGGQEERSATGVAHGDGAPVL